MSTILPLFKPFLPLFAPLSASLRNILALPAFNGPRFRRGLSLSALQKILLRSTIRVHLVRNMKELDSSLAPRSSFASPVYRGFRSTPSKHSSTTTISNLPPFYSFLPSIYPLYIYPTISEPSSSTERSNDSQRIKISTNDFETEMKKRPESSRISFRSSFRTDVTRIEHLSYRRGELSDWLERATYRSPRLSYSRQRDVNVQRRRCLSASSSLSGLDRRRLLARFTHGLRIHTYKGPRDKVIRINWPLIN